MLKVKLVRSPIGYNWRLRQTVEALGLKKMQSEVTHEDTPSIRGMIKKVSHMITVEEIKDETKKARSKKDAAP